MAERRHLFIGRDGLVRSERRTVEGTSNDFGDRIRGLAAEISERNVHDGPAERFALVYCDRCGRPEMVDLAAPKLPSGWQTVEGVGDVCPTCL